MKNPFRNLDELQRDLGDIAVRFTHLQFEPFTIARCWQPAINAFRCGGVFIICVELAGVERSALDLQAEPRRLILRGRRLAPEPPCDDPVLQVLAIEIDHGPFERILNLPAEIEPTAVVAEHRHGILWIRLPLRTQG